MTIQARCQAILIRGVPASVSVPPSPDSVTDADANRLVDENGNALIYA